MSDQPHRDRAPEPRRRRSSGPTADAAELDALARRLADLGPERHPRGPAGGPVRRHRSGAGRRRSDAAGRRRGRRWLRAAGPGVLVLVGAGVPPPPSRVGRRGVARASADDDPAPHREVAPSRRCPGFEQAHRIGHGRHRRRRPLGGGRPRLTDVDVPAGSHLELWLLDEAVEQLVPLGRSSPAPARHHDPGRRRPRGHPDRRRLPRAGRRRPGPLRRERGPRPDHLTRHGPP